jgi:ribosome-binding ATPase YchF (GTP1/OBG family)
MIASEEKLNKLRMHELSAIDSMVNGVGTVQDWKTIVHVLNVSETMGHGGIGIEVLPVCALVEEELKAAAKRYEATQKMGLSGLGIKYLKELFALHDLQRQSISCSEFQRMIDKSNNNVRSNHQRVVHI